MSADLLKQLRKNRELAVTVGKFTFTARRPTDMEAIDLFEALRKSKSQASMLAAMGTIAQRYVVGWSGFVEDDIAGGGGSQIVVEFDPELWSEWCADHREVWQTIAQPVIEAYQAHRKAMEAVKGN